MVRSFLRGAYSDRLAGKHDQRCRKQLPGYCASVQAARNRPRQHRVTRRDYAPATAARGFVVVQPVDPTKKEWAPHRDEIAPYRFMTA